MCHGWSPEVCGEERRLSPRSGASYGEARDSPAGGACGRAADGRRQVFNNEKAEQSSTQSSKRERRGWWHLERRPFSRNGTTRSSPSPAQTRKEQTDFRSIESKLEHHAKINTESHWHSLTSPGNNLPSAANTYHECRAFPRHYTRSACGVRSSCYDSSSRSPVIRGNR